MSGISDSIKVYIPHPTTKTIMTDKEATTEYKLNSGVTIRLSNVKFDNNNDIGNLHVTSIPVEAQAITIQDDEYQAELDQINEDIRFKREEINHLEMQIATLRTQIYDLDNEQYNIMDLIEKKNSGEKS